MLRVWVRVGSAGPAAGRSAAARPLLALARLLSAGDGAGRRGGAEARDQTVLSAGPRAEPPPVPPPPPPPPPRAPSPAAPPPARRAWALAAAAALAASLGGVYAYRRLTDDPTAPPAPLAPPAPRAEHAEGPPEPAQGAAFPPHVQFLVVGGGTAAFAAMRALRAASPDAHVLLVSEEHALPYMRPPLSKELWREERLDERAARPDSLSFRQWDGRRRGLLYEPPAFYAPVERLRAGAPGAAAVARGWRVERLDVPAREAELRAPGCEPVRVRYDECLVATGSRPRRLAALRAAADAGRSLALRTLRDAARLAAALDEPGVRRVAVVGGGFLATELSAALAERMRARGVQVVQLVAERAPLEAALPAHLAREAARRLREAGVALRTRAVVAGAELRGARVLLRLDGAEPEELEADVVVECVGAEPAGASLARASGLELDPALGGVLVNAELRARAGVWAAGDAACYHDVLLGRRRVEHHDHAVLSGRLAGQNMARAEAPQPYLHQSMFWSDLGPQLGYEAVGLIDSRLQTVSVFSSDAVLEPAARTAEAGAKAEAGAVAGPEAGEEAGAERGYSRGVVLYVRERRVVGVLLWNLFNRMHVARQVLAQGEFEDLFEVAKLFAPHEDE